MQTILISITSLLVGISILLLGHGLTNTLLTLRAATENYPDSQIGLIMSSYFVGYILGSLYCPGLINRIGHIRVFAVAAAICGSIVIAQGLWVNPVFWILARMIYGVCIVAFYFVVESWLNTRVDNTYRGRIFAVYMVVNLLAMAAGQQLLLVGDIRQLELFAIAAALFSLSLVPIALTRMSQPEPVEKPKIDIKHLYEVSPIGFAGCFAAGLAGSAFWTMSPLFAYQAGLTTSAVAAFMSATIIGGALLQWPVGLYSDKHDRRKILAIISFAATLFAIISAFTNQFSMPIMLTVMFFYGGLYFAVYPLSVALTNDQAKEGDFVNLTGSLLLVYGVGSTIGPLLAGLLIQLLGPYSLPSFYAVCWLLLGLFVIYHIKQSGAIPIDDSNNFTPMIRTSQAALQTQSETESESV
tara:strand:- start:323 stop:1558 length:1236 start_codon:yes stop_codon:yes gene_type:complete